MTKELALALCSQRFKDELKAIPLFDHTFNSNLCRNTLVELLRIVTPFSYVSKNKEDLGKTVTVNDSVNMSHLSTEVWNYTFYREGDLVKGSIPTVSVREHLLKILFDLNRQIELAGGIDDNQK